MTPEQYEQVCKLFDEADRRPLEERAAYLQQACTNPLLRAEVERMLAGAEEASARGFLEYSAPSVLPPEGPGTRVGPYKLLHELGHGGMGVVYLAEQQHPVQRQVALKVIQAGMNSAVVVARFEAERQALALMDHPHIAKVLDAGATASGLPFFVMELVKGIPFTTYCDQERVPLKERLELFVAVCQAVQHAHQKGVIHRDLKPSNVLVALYDGRPLPKVIDFGIAKATGAKLTDKAMFTEAGQLLGTLLYMAPEQAERTNLDIDTRADVYALGGILYELLTGSTPLGEQMRGLSREEMQRLIGELEPQRVSSKLSHATDLPKIAAKRRLEPKQLVRLVRGDLDWIVMKCLEKERARRYETANGLAQDVQRYLADEPVVARPPSTGYRVRKFLRRNRGPVLAAAMVLMALLTAMVGTSWGLVEAWRQGDAAEQARNDEAAQRQQAMIAKDRADRNLRLAREAVDKTVTKITANPRLKEADFHQLRQELLQYMVPFYEEFVKQRENDPELEAERGRAWRSLASLRQEMGQYEGARSDYEQIRALFAQLAADFPTVPQYRHELARSCNGLGIVLGQLGRRGDAEAAQRDVLKVEAQLVADFPTVPQYRLSLAKSYNNLGILLHELGKPSDAETAFRDGFKIQAQLVADFPGVPEYRLDLAASYNSLGILLHELGPKQACPPPSLGKESGKT